MAEEVSALFILDGDVDSLADLYTQVHGAVQAVVPSLPLGAERIGLPGCIRGSVKAPEEFISVSRILNPGPRLSRFRPLGALSVAPCPC